MSIEVVGIEIPEVPWNTVYPMMWRMERVKMMSLDGVESPMKMFWGQGDGVPSNLKPLGA